MRTIWRSAGICALLAAWWLATCSERGAWAQQAAPLPGGNFPGANQGGNQGQAVNGFVGGGNIFGSGNGANGGAASADFDSLIDLITSTVDVESWQENGTGQGEVQPFPNGVYADADGALLVRAGGERAALAAVRAHGTPRSQPAVKTLGIEAVVEAKAVAERHFTETTDAARQSSPLRYVSLSKLEAAIAQRQERHEPLEPAMLSLAGLQRVSFVLAYPETGDLVLAGPAGDWAGAPTGGLVSVETGRPIVRLDDLLTLWRRQRTEKSAAFGCSIVPRQEALANTQAFLDASAAKPLEPSGRRKWLEELRSTLGIQDVEYYNIDEGSRIATLLLASDYHMKLIGMGLADGVPGVKSYLATVRNGADGSPPPMAVLRWWFSMPASTVEASDAHDAFALPERSICVLSENEMLAARGQRVHTGQSDDLNRKFAESFTQEFAALSTKYPVYGELERVFELALALAVIQREGLTEKVGWTPTLLLDEQRLRLPSSPAPTAVETVINHRVIGGRQIIAGVSGGVWVDGGKTLQVSAATADRAAALATVKKPIQKAAAGGGDQPEQIAWWWD
ncbi:DUF1598 domain-containing protein [Lacipirellula sp.]|uniref:DUF1598 domain-containing protein n=1 Tax=Lacipirellula sp. TaxID=2691419 RepID=UPI003D107A0D